MSECGLLFFYRQPINSLRIPVGRPASGDSGRFRGPDAGDFSYSVFGLCYNGVGPEGS